MDLKPKGLFKRVFDFARAGFDRRSRPPERIASDSSPTREVAPEPVPLSAAVPKESQAHVEAADLPLEVSRRTAGALMVRWALTEDDVATARPLTSAQATLSIRLISFSTVGPDVHREVLDLPATTLSGDVTLQRPERERLLVSVGLLSPDAFVSIVHAQLD